MKINLTDYTKACDCGKVHEIVLKDVILGKYTINQLPKLLNQYGYEDWSKITFLCDNNTYLVAGKKVEEIIQGINKIELDSVNLHADNHGVALVKEQLLEDTELLIAVGSGTIHDLTRYIAKERNIDFISVPTAASVDGYVSTVSAMTWDGFKKTLPGVSPILVIADTTIYMNAPYRLTASGISDLFAKYIAIADWKIAHILTDEYICNRICDLEMVAMNYTLQQVEALQSDNEERKVEAFEALMYSLLLSGIAMQMTGNSRPASGAEHHISHLLEMEIINDTLPYYHGEKVSVGLLIALKEYKKSIGLLKSNPRIKEAVEVEYDLLKSTFGNKGLYESIIEENSPNPLNLVIRGRLIDKKGDILQILEELPDDKELYSVLESSKCVTTLEQLGVDTSLRPLIQQLSPYVRNRLTWMRIIKYFT